MELPRPAAGRTHSAFGRRTASAAVARWAAPAAPRRPDPGGARMTSRKALVRRPAPRLAEGIVTHVERTEVDLALALRQWEAYVEVLRGDGWEIVEVPPADDCPDSVFVEDAVVMFRNVAVLTRPGAPSRRP